MKYVICLLWLLSTFFANAQTEKPRKLFIGLQAAAQRYEVRYPVTGINEVGIIPWQLTTGYRFTPRLTAQLGVSYRGTSRNWYNVQTSFSGSDTYRHLTVPATVRWTIGYRPERKFNFDAVGGMTVLFSKHEFPFLVDGVPPSVLEITERLTQFYLTFGIGTRYRFGNRLEGVGDFMLNKSTKPGGAINLRFYSVGLGLRYNL